MPGAAGPCQKGQDHHRVVQRLPGLRVPAPFAKEFPEQFVEMGIAEQSLVSTAVGMARCGLRPFAASPASFLSTRSMEQVKVDVAYSHTNVKLIGISVGAVGISNQRETALLWDRDTGLPVADAVVWQCARAAGICQRLADRGGGHPRADRPEPVPLFPGGQVGLAFGEHPRPRRKGPVCRHH